MPHVAPRRTCSLLPSNWARERRQSSVGSTRGSIAVCAKHPSMESDRAITRWHSVADCLPGAAEWAARWPDNHPQQGGGIASHSLNAPGRGHTPPPVSRDSRQASLRKPSSTRVAAANAEEEIFTHLRNELAEEIKTLLRTKPEFEANPTPRGDVVTWWHMAEAVLSTSPISARHQFDPAARRDLVREYRRVSRQLMVTGRTRPEPLPEVTPDKAREVAFKTAAHRGKLLLAQFGKAPASLLLFAAIPGESWDI